MGLGVLNVKRPVPGTSTLQDLQTKNAPASGQDFYSRHRNLKYDTSGKEPVLLVPQPSDDPNDPLNLPRWQRDLIVFILSLFSVLATTLSPLLAANSLVIAVEMHITISEAALLTGWHLLAVGIVGLVCVPLASKYGKRHLYLIGALLTIISCAAAGQTPRDEIGSHHGYNYLIAWRVVQGAGLAPFEGLVNASVGDLFFVHERGKRMALSNLAIFGGAFFTPVICGVITDEIGWRWAFNLVAILTGAMFPLLFFFVPETAFRRPHVADASGFENSYTAAANVEATEQSDGSSAEAAYHEPKGAAVTAIGVPASPTPAKRSYWQTLMPFNGTKTDESLIKLFFRPFPLFLQPGIIWAMFIQGTIIGWTVLIGIVLAAVFYIPPLWFTPRETGYSYAAAFIGALVGFAISGLLADSSTRWMTRLNKGIYEPEFRMVLVIPCFILGCMGLYGFGYTTNDLERYGWIGPVVFFGLEVAGMVCGAVASALYIADAHPDVAVAAFTCVLVFKNVFSFGLSVHGYDWLIVNSNFDVFIIVASVQAGVCALTVPMYIFGKWNRAFWARVDVLSMLRLK